MNDKVASLNDNGEYDPYIISLSDEDGTDYEFEVLDDIDYNDARYLALLPVYDDPDEMLRDSGEMVILKAVPGDEPESEEYEEIQDDNEYEDVAAVFADRLQDLTSKIFRLPCACTWFAVYDPNNFNIGSPAPTAGLQTSRFMRKKGARNCWEDTHLLVTQVIKADIRQGGLSATLGCTAR